MDLNSPLFDRIRVKPEQRQERRETRFRCDAPGCEAAGEYRAPMGRLREGQYFCFCLEHVREYNNSYNYFNGMSDEAVARYLKDDATTGHRPTWSMGVKRGQASFREDPLRPDNFADPMGLYRQRAHRARPQAEASPRYSAVTIKALNALGLDETAGAEAIKTRYKELVKRHHPDANGGDRSCEERLREIIHAYKTLRAAKLV
ncbi:J domain-containing protein [Methylosinus sporium]|jgi:DnaJ-class molecular chaperone with C-terminal Zn finger domain|uniref:J domain-containing protein n=1 Tax=Methylosinus sporium TaxID=428 RepID=A0A549T993_METSR|nr:MULTISPECIES: DnaJ domain-containing protein [Methylosinus]MBU3890882.1 J domain-containing protein [Methylosinus sp. KRF6]TRL38438.1 J domain-containing protein [Methylosinus sporium]